MATDVAAPVHVLCSGVVALAASAVSDVPRVRVDNLPHLPNSSHHYNTDAYRIEQLDELERRLEAERERDGIPTSNTAWHLTWNPRRPLDFRPCGLLWPWLWFSNHRTHHVRFHDELEWPENDRVGWYLQRQVNKADILTSSTNLNHLISIPNTVVNRIDAEAKQKWYGRYINCLPATVFKSWTRRDSSSLYICRTSYVTPRTPRSRPIQTALGII